MVRLLHMPYRDSDTLHDALKARMAGLPPVLLRSITWDQGTEMARHLTITRSLGAPVYFCDSHAPWRRGSNENTNGLLRDYFPKGTDLSVHSPQHPARRSPGARSTVTGKLRLVNPTSVSIALASPSSPTAGWFAQNGQLTCLLGNASELAKPARLWLHDLCDLVLVPDRVQQGEAQPVAGQHPGLCPLIDGEGARLVPGRVRHHVPHLDDYAKRIP